MSIRLLGRVIYMILLGLGTICATKAQNPTPQPTVPPQISDYDVRQGILTGDVARVPLAEVVVGAGRCVSVSPPKNYVLFARRTAVEIRDIKETRGLLPPTRAYEELLLWGPGSRQPTTLLRRELGTTLWNGSGIVSLAWRIGEYTDARIDSVQWFAGTDVALVTLRIGPTLPPSDEVTPYSVLETADSPKAKTQVLRVDAARGVVEELALQDYAPARAYFSRVEPVAALFSPDKKQVAHLDATGTLTQFHPVVLSDGCAVMVRWMVSLPGGRWYGNLIEDDENKANSNPPMRPVTLDVVTGVVRDYDKNKEGKYPLALDTPLPYRLLRATGELPVYPRRLHDSALWMDSRDLRETERGLVCVDTDPSQEVYGLNDAVFYYRNGTLGVKPLLALPRAAFLARSHALFKSDILARAREIQAASRRYARNHQGKLPPPDAFVRGAGSLAAEASVFQNPATKMHGFTVTYRKADRKPTARLILGYLSCPAGRAIVYYTGEPGWQDATT